MARYELLGMPDEFESPRQQQNQSRQTQSRQQPRQESFPEASARVAAGTISDSLKNLIDIPKNLLGSAGRFAQMAVGSPDQTKVPIPDIAKQYATPEQLKRLDALVKEQYKENQSGLAPLGQAVQELLPDRRLIESAEEYIGADEYLKPRSETEKMIREFGSDIASLMVPLGPLGGGLSAKRSLYQSAAGNAAKWLTKTLGFSEGTQDAVKAGTMFLTSFGMQDSLKDKAQGLYKQVEKDIRPNETIAMPEVRRSINKINEEITHGGLPLQEKKYLQESINAMGNAFTGEEMSLRNAWQTSMDLGRFIKKVGPNTPEGVTALKLQKQISDAVQKGPNEVVAKGLKEANNLWRGYKDSTKTMSWIGKQLKKKGNLTSGALASVINPVAAQIGAGVGLVGGLSAYSHNIAKTVLNNPTVAKEWLNMMKHAVKENSAAFSKSYNRLNNKLTKMVPKQNENRPERNISGKKYELLGM